MAEVFRILDRFRVTGRGIVYLLSMDENSNIKIGDIFFDLQGNGFKVKGIEMLRRLVYDCESIGVMLEANNDVEVEGNILVKDIYDVNFIFCNHPLYQRRVDEAYEEEIQAARLHHACSLFSYEDMEYGKLSLYGEKISGLTIYRGWMMKPEMYRNFYKALESRGIVLINTPEEYERYHLLPQWYKEFEQFTADSVWETQGNLDNVIKLTKKLEGAYIVKDYVKSRKHEWYDACFISDISNQDNTRRIVANFIDRQADSMVGGVVLRKFINLKPIGFHEQSGMPLSEEYRVFVYAGKILILDNYWNDNQESSISNEEYKWIEDICKRIKSNFATLDIARKSDGVLVIMELGDGQVSGLQQIEANHFYNRFPYSIPVEELISKEDSIIEPEP